GGCPRGGEIPSETQWTEAQWTETQWKGRVQMNAEYLSPIANHLWQSTLFAAAAGLLTLGLRKNYARVRHWVWLSASCKFLIPLAALVALGGQITWRTIPEKTPSQWEVVMGDVSQPFIAPAALPSAAPPHSAPNLLPLAIVIIWSCGFLGIACSW